LSSEYLREFSKKLETALIVYSGAWGKLIHEKNQKQKSRDTVPLSKQKALVERLLHHFLSFSVKLYYCLTFDEDRKRKMLTVIDLKHVCRLVVDFPPERLRTEPGAVQQHPLPHQQVQD
jgi:hypothetical protein